MGLGLSLSGTPRKALANGLNGVPAAWHGFGTLFGNAGSEIDRCFP